MHVIVFQLAHTHTSLFGSSSFLGTLAFVFSLSTHLSPVKAKSETCSKKLEGKTLKDERKEGRREEKRFRN